MKYHLLLDKEYNEFLRMCNLDEISDTIPKLNYMTDNNSLCELSHVIVVYENKLKKIYLDLLERDKKCKKLELDLQHYYELINRIAFEPSNTYFGFRESDIKHVTLHCDNQPNYRYYLNKLEIVKPEYTTKYNGKPTQTVTSLLLNLVQRAIIHMCMVTQHATT